MAPAARREQLPALGCEAWRVVRQAVRAFQEEPGFGLERHPEQRFHSILFAIPLLKAGVKNASKLLGFVVETRAGLFCFCRISVSPAVPVGPEASLRKKQAKLEIIIIGRCCQHSPTGQQQEVVPGPAGAGGLWLYPRRGGP